MAGPKADWAQSTALVRGTHVKSSFQPFHEKQALLRKVVAALLRYDDAGMLREQRRRPTAQAPRQRRSPRQRGVTSLS
jgi:hypothetical protein